MGMVAPHCHVTKTTFYEIMPAVSRRLHIKFGFDWPRLFQRRICLQIMVIYLYIYARADYPKGAMFFKNINLLGHLLQVSLIQTVNQI